MIIFNTLTDYIDNLLLLNIKNSAFIGGGGIKKLKRETLDLYLKASIEDFFNIF